MFRRATQRRLAQKPSLRLNRLYADRRLTIEPLEDRRLLSLVLQGVTLAYPQITYDALGPLSYNADSQSLSFQLDATPLTFRQAANRPRPARSIRALRLRHQHPRRQPRQFDRRRCPAPT